MRVDPGRRAVIDRVPTGGGPAGLAAVGGAAWATVVRSPAAHRGGTLRVGSRPIDLDPARSGYVAPGVALLELTYDGLLAYRRAPGVAGAQLTGDLARAVPRPSDNGRSYVFQLRRGLKYSDGTPVRASDVRASMQRLLTINGVAAQLFGAIEGAGRCRVAGPCDLSRGISTDDAAGTVTMHLRHPDPELLGKLAGALAAVVPQTTPRGPLGRRAPLGTGPYRIAQLVPSRHVLFTRNPYFGASGPERRPAGFADRIDVTLGPEGIEAQAAARGQLDVSELFTTATPARVASLRARIGARLRSGADPEISFAWMNTRAPPFDDRRVRRALNFAIDRKRVVRLSGGAVAGSLTCQLLPPGMPSYRPVCPFTVSPSASGAWAAPDLPRARRLIAASGTRGTPVVVLAYRGDPDVARYITRLLGQLGFRSRVRLLSFDQLDRALSDRHRRPQIGLNGWIADVPKPAGLLRALISCHSYTPGDSSGTNESQFCDHRLDTAIDRAEAAGSDAGTAWQRIERRIDGAAPVVPLLNARLLAVTSTRAHNLRFSPFNAMLLDQVWLH